MDQFTETDFIAFVRQVAQPAQSDAIPVGIGDDAALVAPPPGEHLAICVDSLVSGVHFPTETDPYDVGYKAAAVNLSDCAAMAALPAFALCALTHPTGDAKWLKAFTRGLCDALQPYGCRLIGGDVTAGPLCVSVTLGGYVSPGAAHLRSQARVGDRIFVTGPLGLAHAGLKHLQGKTPLPPAKAAAAIAALNRPTARVHEARAIAPFIHALMDVSDGLATDLPRLLKASGVAGQIDLTACPRPRELMPELSEATLLDYAISGGDDYALLGTLAPEHIEAVISALKPYACPIHFIGEIVAGSGLTYYDVLGHAVTGTHPGYEHFKA